MRVFYPISARFSDFTNDKEQTSSGVMMVWSMLCIALLMLVLSALPSFEEGATQKHEQISNDHFSHAVHVMPGQVNHHSGNVHASKSLIPAKQLHVSTQDYIDAHRCAQYFACFTPVTQVEPAKPKAGGDQYL